jgi:transposase
VVARAGLSRSARKCISAPELGGWGCETDQAPQTRDEMQLKTLLNRVQKHKGFVYDQVRLVEGGGPRLVVGVRPRGRSRPRCSKCHEKGPGYDTLTTRYFEFVPVWGMAVVFAYAMRRVNCATCGVTVEEVPWAVGKSPVTTTYAWFLAAWAKRMSWTEVARAFHTNWGTVFRAVELAVDWGLQHRECGGIRAIGVDEVLWHRGHKYLTVVYQIDEHCRRLLWVGRDRTTETLETFFNEFGLRTRWLRWVCSDMWRPYLDVIARRATNAVHILDRFHIAAKMNKTIDEVRAEEARRMKREGHEPVLKRSRWCLLKRPENLTERQGVKLAELLRYNLRTVKAYLLKEDLQLLWGEPSPERADTFIKDWTFRAMRSRIEPVKKIARSLRRHSPLILNWFRAHGRISAGSVEGMNNKLKVITRRAFGFRTYRATQVALYHGLGDLPEPQGTHRFA